MFRRTRILLFILVAAAILPAMAVIRLYLKDGTYQLAREYQVKEDRVRYFSSEREEWEEIPLELIDLARTKKETVDKEAAAVQEIKEEAEEDKALNDAAKEITLVPGAPGVYYLRGEKLEPIKVADSKIVNDKKRAALKILSPVPMVAGRETVEIDGDNAATRVADRRPEFYFRLADEERFGIFKLTQTKKNSRIVETIQIAPVTKELIEQFDEVDCFKKQGGDLLFKIWPQKDLEPGEYALIEHTDGKLNLQVWDFGVGEGTPPPPEKKRSIFPKKN
jgi:cell division protein FtsL